MPLALGLGIGLKKPMLKGLAAYKSNYAFWAGELDYTTNQWKDQSGKNRHVSLVKSYCLNFNGTNAKVSFTFPNVATADGIKIWARPSGGEWAIYTAGTAPTGLYRKTGNLLEIGYNGSVYWAGDVAMVQLLSGSTVIWEKPFAQGRGDILKSAYTYGARRDDALYNLTDANSDNILDGILVTKASGTSYTSEIKNDGANGWVGRYFRLTITAVDAGNQAFGFSKDSPSGAVSPNVKSWFKVKLRTNRTVRNNIQNYSSGGTPYSHYATSETIYNLEVNDITANNMSRFYISAYSSIQVNDYWEFQDFEYGEYSTDAGTITNATWAATNSYIHKNLQYGYDLWRDASSNLLFATRLSDGTSILATGGTLASYTWVGKYDAASTTHNGAETALNFPDVAALKAIDTNNVLYDSGGAANDVTFDTVYFSGNYLLSNSYHLRILRKKSDIIVLSSTTNYAKINDLLYADAYKFQTVKVGNYHYIRFDGGGTGYDYVLGIIMENPLYNYDFDNYEFKALNWYDQLSSPVIAAATKLGNITDERNAYIFNAANIGGNHNFETYVLTGSFSIDDTDIGAVYRRGSYDFVIAGFTAGKPVIVAKPIIQYGNAPYLPLYTLGNLTHISGGTHTDTLAPSSVTTVAAVGINTINNLTLKGDGINIADTLSNYKAIQLINDVTIPYIYDEWQFVDGTFNWKAPEDWFREVITIDFCRFGINKHTKVTAIKEVARVDYVRANQFLTFASAAVTSRHLYIPNVEAYSGIDFRNKVNYTALTAGTTFNRENCETGKTPNRFITLGLVSTTPTHAKTEGFHPEFGDTSDANRATNLENTQEVFLVTITPKMGGRIISKVTPGSLPIAGTIDMKGYEYFYNVNRSDNMTSIYYYKEGTDIYLFIDCHTTVTNQVVSIPYELSYKTVTVMDKNTDMTVNSSTTGCGTISVSVANNYGYAVIKLS